MTTQEWALWVDPGLFLSNSLLSSQNHPRSSCHGMPLPQTKLTQLPSLPYCAGLFSLHCKRKQTRRPSNCQPLCHSSKKGGWKTSRMFFPFITSFPSHLSPLLPTCLLLIAFLKCLKASTALNRHHRFSFYDNCTAQFASRNAKVDTSFLSDRNGGGRRTILEQLWILSAQESENPIFFLKKVTSRPVFPYF